MMTWRKFLLEHAKFPFPLPVENGSVSTTDISMTEVGLLDEDWKAQYAIRDENLVQKLCGTLENILGDAVLTDKLANDLLTHFGRRLQYPLLDDIEEEDSLWAENESEAKSRALLDAGFFSAAKSCLRGYGRYKFILGFEDSVEGGRSRVDYVVMVNDKTPRVLVEAKSPLVMMRVGDLLPPHGIKLEWVPNQTLVSKIFHKVALYLGLRKMEWLFLSCHNYWIICRLVTNNGHSFLAYSPKISIENSSAPFRAFFGAVLSAINDVPVEPSIFSPGMTLDVIPEEGSSDSSSEPDDDGSGAYRGSLRTTVSSTPPVTGSCSTAGGKAAESALMITSSSPNSPESFQVWMKLHPLSNNTFAPPQCAQNGKEMRRLWLTRFIGHGLRGNVWECCFDNSDHLFAVKIVELLRRSDEESPKRFRNEFKVYLAMEKVYQSGQLRDRITPHCYGAFEGGGVHALILELCDRSLNDWDELDCSERIEVFKLVRDLHRVGIVHGDLAPRNIARARGGGFRLIDFSESRKHNCKEHQSESHATRPATPLHYKCSELEAFRNELWKQQPHHARPGNLTEQ